MWEVGAILEGNKLRNEAYHPIIYMGEMDDDHFLGCMLTSSNSTQYRDNIPLLEYHFEKTDESGAPYSIYYRPESHIVRYVFIKKNSWGPFKKKGMLSNEGIKFVTIRVAEQTPQHFIDYTQYT